jgi:signal transduction histidine kinase
MKYVDKEGGKILVKMTKKDTQIYINIEDNGQ